MVYSALFKELVKRCVSYSVSVVKPLCREFVVCQHLHAKASADVDEHPSDAACSDDAHRFAVKVEACHTGETKVVVSGADERLVDASDGRKQHRHSVLGDRIGRVGRNSQNVYPSEGILHVNVVEACAS